MKKLLIGLTLCLGLTCLQTGCSRHVLHPDQPVFLAQDVHWVRVATLDRNTGKVIIVPQRVTLKAGQAVFWPAEIPTADTLGLNAGPFDWLGDLFNKE